MLQLVTFGDSEFKGCYFWQL